MSADLPGSLVLVVGYEGSDPARRALGAAGRILEGREGWIEVVYVAPNTVAPDSSADPPADVIDSLGQGDEKLHFEITSLLGQESQPWRLRSTSGAVAEQLIETAKAIAAEGGPSRTVVIVVGSDRRLALTVPVALTRRSKFPVVVVP